MAVSRRGRAFARAERAARVRPDACARPKSETAAKHLVRHGSALAPVAPGAAADDEHPMLARVVIEIAADPVDAERADVMHKRALALVRVIRNQRRAAAEKAAIDEAALKNAVRFPVEPGRAPPEFAALERSATVEQPVPSRSLSPLFDAANPTISRDAALRTRPSQLPAANAVAAAAMSADEAARRRAFSRTASVLASSVSRIQSIALERDAAVSHFRSANGLVLRAEVEAQKAAAAAADEVARQKLVWPVPLVGRVQAMELKRAASASVRDADDAVPWWGVSSSSRPELRSSVAVPDRAAVAVEMTLIGRSASVAKQQAPTEGGDAASVAEVDAMEPPAQRTCVDVLEEVRHCTLV